MYTCHLSVRQLYHNSCLAHCYSLGSDIMIVLQELCDITLCASGQEFRCHRVVLVSASKYFYTMFAGSFVEKSKGNIELSEITNDCLQVVLDFIYTGKLMTLGYSRPPYCNLAIKSPVGYLIARLSKA